MGDKGALLSVKPKFNIIYEMFMPTGRKIRNTLLILIIAIICYFFVTIALNSSTVVKIQVIQENKIDIYKVFNTISIFIISVLALKLTLHLTIQILQYKAVKYTFYEDYMEYEDTFLNQHRKTIRYDNIKEVEIRRTVWDRMNGYGMVIIYSNAEKASEQGLILYSIKNPEEVYAKIDEMIHNKFSIQKENVATHSGVNPVNVATEKELDFKESLKSKE